MTVRPIANSETKEADFKIKGSADHCEIQVIYTDYKAWFSFWLSENRRVASNPVRNETGLWWTADASNTMGEIPKFYDQNPPSPTNFVNHRVNFRARIFNLDFV